MKSELFVPIEAKAEYVIEKSKFLSFCYYVDSKDRIQTILKDLRRDYLDSTHICYAYRLLDESLNEYVCGTLGFSQSYFDDGEPSGTAGAPILRAIEESDMYNALVVVVRYFGGIKLGAAGLTRAYHESAQMSIKTSKKSLMKIYSITCDYAMINKIINFCETSNGKILTRDFGEKATFGIGILENVEIPISISQNANVIFMGNKYL